MALSFIKDPAAFVPPAGGVADFIDWGQFPDSGPIPFPVRSGCACVSQTGRACTIFIRNKHLTQRVQDGGPSWNGNFAPGDILLFTDFTPGPLEFVFPVPIRGIGTQMDIQDVVEHVNLSIRVFAGDSRLTIPEHGTRTDGAASSAGDGSAPFLGTIDSSAPRIPRAVFSLTVRDPGYRGDSSFAINRLRLIL